VHGEANGWAPRHSERGGGEFDSNSNFKWIRIIFKFVQTLTAPKRTFPGLNFFKQNMAKNILKKGTMISIGTSSDSKYILN
jgi:hypothetical protein